MPRFSQKAVCSPLTLASSIGLDVLRDGGNAVDAAVATNLGLAVAYPHMCGVGGDLLAMVWPILTTDSRRATDTPHWRWTS